MWQRFTEKARRAIFFAQEEAGRHGENLVSTEHLLLGLARGSDSTAARVLGCMNVSLSAIKTEVESQISRGDGHFGQDMQLTPRAKKVIDLSYDEARRLDNNFIGTEHILLGLVRESDGMAGRILAKLGAEIERTREITASLQAGSDEAPKGPGKAGSEAGAVTDLISSEGHKSRAREMMANVRGAQEQMAAQAGMVCDLQQTSKLRGRDLLSIDDLSPEEIDLVFSTTSLLKQGVKEKRAQPSLLRHKTLAMIFEKPSLRTRVTFEVGMTQLGGHAVYLQPSDISLGVRETVADAARNLDRWLDVIMARVFSHSTVAELAKHAGIPVINALSDLEHPCQALADFYTIKEYKGDFAGLKLAYVGDGNNVCHSLMLLAAKVGTSMSVGCPPGYEPNPDIVAAAEKLAEDSGAIIEITNDPVAAVRHADAVYTDVWASMGQESEKAEREKIFPPYQVNAELLKHAKDDVIFLHCLPAHRGDEVTDEVMDGRHSVVFDEAENRLHVQKALLVLLVEE
jgi:ornithine carbamoyltransferase